MKTLFSLPPHRLRASWAAATFFAVLLSVGGTARAVEVKFSLTGAAEVPPIGTWASGQGAIDVHPDRTVSGIVTTAGIGDTMAHIHLGKLGSNGPVVVTLLWDGDGAWRVPAGARLTEAQYRSFLAGELYVNVHSVDFKGGEIRAQLVPPPSPSAAAMPVGR